jgi:hypothetical protein
MHESMVPSQPSTDELTRSLEEADAAEAPDIAESIADHLGARLEPPATPAGKAPS